MPYCSEEFQRHVEEILQTLRGTIRIVDVGSAFGDCMLWTAAIAGCNRTYAIGFDLSQQLSRLAFKSAVRSKFSTCVDVRWGHISDVFQNTTTRMRPIESVGDMHAIPHGTSTLDRELAHHEKIHIVKIHTIVDEHKVVRGAEKIIRGGGVGIFVIHIGMLEVNFLAGVSFMEFLEALDDVKYECMVYNDTVVTSKSFSNVTLWHRSYMFELTCRRTDFQDWLRSPDRLITPKVLQDFATQ